MDENAEFTADTEGSDRSALLMMLAYVEAECRRLGAEAAAEHAARAAALMPAPAPLPQRAGAPLH